jgi:PAS domain S-box-containing protein
MKKFAVKIKRTQALRRTNMEHKQTTGRLQESEEIFRVLTENAMVGIYIIQDDIFRYVNPRFLSIFGYPMEEIIGQHYLKMVAEEDRPLVTRNTEQWISGEVDFLSYEFKVINKEGEIVHVEIYGTRFYYQDRPAMMGTLIDVTDRKRAEAELIKSQTLESIGILAGGIAHDFNNLLSIIIGYLATAQQRLENNAEHKIIFKMLESAEKSSHQATELAQKLITFSQGGWIHPQRVTLSGILEDIPYHYPGMELLLRDASIPPDLEPLYGDERQLRQVLVNLLQNADEAMTEPKQVFIKAQNVTPDAYNDFSLNEGLYVKISIRDNGKGIPQDQLGKIFDPYFSTKHTVSQKGMGLGLAICYSIVQKHNGHIMVESQLGKGTTVTLYMPAYRENGK